MIVREAKLTDAFSIAKVNMGKMTDSKAWDAKRKQVYVFASKNNQES